MKQDIDIPTVDDINRQFDSYQHQLDLSVLHLKPLVRFDTSEMDDLLDMIETGNTAYIDLLKKQLN